jgi:hypothetical protein
MKNLNDDYFYNTCEYEEKSFYCAYCGSEIGDEAEYGGEWNGLPVCINCIQEAGEDEG